MQKLIGFLRIKNRADEFTFAKGRVDKKKTPTHVSGHYEIRILYFFAGAAFAGAAGAAAGAAAAAAGAVAAAAAGLSVDSSWRNCLVVTTEAIGILGEFRIS